MTSCAPVIQNPGRHDVDSLPLPSVVVRYMRPEDIDRLPVTIPVLTEGLQARYVHGVGSSVWVSGDGMFATWTYPHGGGILISCSGSESAR
jgi:hypothetical protein